MYLRGVQHWILVVSNIPRQLLHPPKVRRHALWDESALRNVGDGWSEVEEACSAFSIWTHSASEMLVLVRVADY